MAKAKKKAKPCNCVEQVNEELAKRGAKIDQTLMFNFDSRKATLSAPSIQLKRVGQGKKKLPTLFCSYCPFCGRKFPE